MGARIPQRDGSGRTAYDWTTNAAIRGVLDVDEEGPEPSCSTTGSETNSRLLGGGTGGSDWRVRSADHAGVLGRAE
jgi:hypothetical protein